MEPEEIDLEEQKDAFGDNTPIMEAREKKGKISRNYEGNANKNVNVFFESQEINIPVSDNSHIVQAAVPEI